MYFVLLSISLRTTTQEESGAFVILLGWESNVFCKKVSAECLLSIFSPVLHARPSKPTSPGERGLASRWAVKTAEVAEVVEAAEAHHHLRALALDLTSGGVLATHTHTQQQQQQDILGSGVRICLWGMVWQDERDGEHGGFGNESRAGGAPDAGERVAFGGPRGLQGRGPFPG